MFILEKKEKDKKKFVQLKIKPELLINSPKLIFKDEEPDVSPPNSERDSDLEFEQMLASVEDMPAEQSTKAQEEPTSETPADPPVRKKAKTKIGNKLRKKKKSRAASKFPDGEVEFYFQNKKKFKKLTVS